MSKGAAFGGAEVVAKLLLDKVDFLGKEQKAVLAGGMAGFCQGIVLSPLLLLKTRVMTSPLFDRNTTPWGQLKGAGSLGKSVLKEGEIMKGSFVFAMKRFADWTTRYYFAGLSERVLFAGQHDLSYKQKIAGGLMGGFLSTCVTIPIDVLVAQVQQKKNAGSKVNLVQSFVDNVKSGKMIAGFIPRVIHVALTTALLRTATTSVYNWLA
jgi:hypothetical protein